MIGSVLLIDDDTDVLRAIGNYFEQLGWEVTRELSGEAGLATYDRDSMLFDKEHLLVPEDLLKRRLGFLRAEYDREHAPEKRS